jgi:hypothetical protein
MANQVLSPTAPLRRSRRIKQINALTAILTVGLLRERPLPFSPDLDEAVSLERLSILINSNTKGAIIVGDESVE